MNIKELETLDIRKASIKELEQAVRVAQHSLNRRISNIKYNSKASQDSVQFVEKSGGRFGFKSSYLKDVDKTDARKYRAALQKEVARAQHFASNKTSTVKGAKEVYKDRVAITFGDNEKLINEFYKLSKKDRTDIITDFWEDFHKYLEVHPIYYNNTPEDVVQSFREVYYKGRGRYSDDTEFYDVVLDNLKQRHKARVTSARREAGLKNETKWSDKF